MLQRRSESGAVSLFLVIFAMLLITVVTLSFLRVMLQDQTASTTSDLSKSALDSAMAGTEDAKRELIYYRTSCMNTSTPASNCASILSNITSDTCNKSVSDVVTVPNDGTEVRIQQTAVTNQSSQVENLNQAYTCVKMQMDTPSYDGSLEADGSKVVPLSSASAFTSVKLSWYSQTDLAAGSKTIDLDSSAASVLLYAPSKWPANRPSLMRAQLMQFGSTFTLSSFDNSTKTGSVTNSNASTLFLYPAPAAKGNTALSFTDDIRKTAPAKPETVACKPNLNTGGYACSVTIAVPPAIGASGASANNRTAYLRLTSLYNAAHFTVELLNGATTVLFDKVQPSIDATGRANDQYRRVQTKVDLMPTDFTYPEAAIDVTGNLCKNFAVTDAAADFKKSTSCTP